MRYNILKVTTCAMALAMAGVGTNGVKAATTVLDFEGSICSSDGNAGCGNGSQIGQNYGDSAIVDVGYRSIDAATNLTYEAFLKRWGTAYGDLTNVVWGGASANAYKSEITFTPVAGYEVSLLGFDAGCFVGRTSCATLNYTASAIGGGAFASGSTPTLYPSHTSVAINSAYFANGITLQWGPDGYDTGLDNIRFDVRQIAPSGAVPEPTTWAMMIGGFGMIGGAMRRGRQTRASALA